MLNKKLIGAVIALSLNFTGAAHAFSITTGSGSLGNIGGFNWAIDSSLNKDAPIDGNTNKAFTVYSQAVLSSYSSNGSPLTSIIDTNLNSRYQITYVMGFGVLGTQAGLDTSFTFNAGPVNFFKVYYTDLIANAGSKANQLDGTCYDGACVGQKLILAGDIVNNDSAVGGTSATGGGFSLNSATAGSVNINQKDPANAGWGTQKTFTGSGSNTAVIHLITANQDYNFFDGLNLGFTALNLLTRTSFASATPSHRVAGQTENLPTVNGDLSVADGSPVCSGASTNTTCDFLYQSTGFTQILKTAPTVVKVPEPGILALMGLGLLGIGLAHRHQKNA